MAFNYCDKVVRLHFGDEAVQQGELVGKGCNVCNPAPPPPWVDKQGPLLSGELM